ncbi:MAG: hypothetical protein HQL15_00890 [Candidatus Omnitrophica bacterium]|nr:hypothetical protein [Candidatus Omnitrophota bacterium]
MKVNVLGYGIMGKQIAGLLCLGGFDVDIYSHTFMDPLDIQRSIKLIARTIKSDKRGKITFVNELNALEDALTIEAVVENIEIKKLLYNKLKTRMSAPIFTNSSSYLSKEIGDDVSIMHFLNPIMLGLVEVSNVNQEAALISVPIIEYLRTIGFDVIFTKDNRGNLANYLIFREVSSVLKLMEQHCYSMDDINKTYNRLYSNRNIFDLIDRVGVDVTYKIILNLQQEDSSVYLPKCLTLALENNILGKKNHTSIKQVLE